MAKKKISTKAVVRKPIRRVGVNSSVVVDKPWKLIEDPTADEDNRFPIGTMWDAYNIKTTAAMGNFNPNMVFEHIRTKKRRFIIFDESKKKLIIISDEERMRRIARDRNDKIVNDAIAELKYEYRGLKLRCQDLSQAGSVADKLLTIGAYSVFVEIKDAPDLDSAVKKVRPKQHQYPGLVFVAASKEDVIRIIRANHKLAQIVTTSVVTASPDSAQKYLVGSDEADTVLQVSMPGVEMTRIL